MSVGCSPQLLGHAGTVPGTRAFQTLISGTPTIQAFSSPSPLQTQGRLILLSRLVQIHEIIPASPLLLDDPKQSHQKFVPGQRLQS